MIIKPSDFVCYMQVNKDDFFLEQTCRRIMGEGVHTFYFHCPMVGWDNKRQDPADLVEVSRITRVIENCGCKVVTSIPVVRPNKYKSRVDCETHVRRMALDEMRFVYGWQHILVVDGDELWKPGSLVKVIQKVKEGARCVSLRMTSVIGLPGYPIEGGTDDAIVYFGPESEIVCCRYPGQGKFEKIEEESIFHFTGTRKTKEEIEAKMRCSGHYDDTRYHFEDWIENVMPNIQPGLVHPHMFLEGKVWPKVREWTMEEIALIPTCYHPYLAVPK